MIPALQAPGSRPERAFTVPWQSGMTGLIVRDDLAPGVNSINDLFDPKYKGKVYAAHRDARHRPDDPEGMGIDPEKATEDQWLKAVDKIQAAADSGQIRRSPATTTSRT